VANQLSTFCKDVINAERVPKTEFRLELCGTNSTLVPEA
jgi:hypothetical protein